MTRNYLNIRLIFCFSVVFMLCECNNSEEISVHNPDLIFTKSFEINIAPYVYIDSLDSIHYQVTGDTLTDTLGTFPEFRWEKVLSNIATIALFRDPILVSENEIQNPESIVWQWHSGMKNEDLEIETITYTRVLYSWGNPVLDKNIQYSTQPLPLQSGLYYWAVWSWDESGRWITFSSKPMKFLVE